MQRIKGYIRMCLEKALNAIGWDLISLTALKKLKEDLRVLKERNPTIPYDYEDLHKSIYSQVEEYTMTSPDRIYSAIEAVKHIVKHEIEGDIVECGVYKGGSSMAMALSLTEFGDQNRNLYLYDTYAGMSTPTDEDVSIGGGAAEGKFQKNEMPKIEGSDWCYSPLEEVERNLGKVNYPMDKIHFVKGKVEDTIPKTIPEKIALLRLDTDWYESTKHELEQLFPRLVPNGILIIDDYGHWQGAKKAVDEYILKNNLNLFLSRIDYTGRLAVKLLK